MDAATPRDTTALLAQMESLRDELERAIAPLTEAQMLARPGGEWSVKDNLTHLALGNQCLHAMMTKGQSIGDAMGVPPDLEPGPDYANLNAVGWERSRDDALPAVLARWRDSHTVLVHTLEATPFEALRAPNPAGGYGPAPLLDYVSGFVLTHYPHHQWMIEDVVRAQAGEGKK